MTSAEVRIELKFRSPSAFAMARKRGHFTLLPTKMPGRRQFLYSTREVATLLGQLAERSAEQTRSESARKTHLFRQDQQVEVPM